MTSVEAITCCHIGVFLFQWFVLCTFGDFLFFLLYFHSTVHLWVSTAVSVSYVGYSSKNHSIRITVNTGLMSAHDDYLYYFFFTILTKFTQLSSSIKT